MKVIEITFTSIFLDRMIVSNSSRRKLPYTCIAETFEGERAYYIPHEDLAGIEIPEDRTYAISENEDEWFPNVLNERLTIFIPGNPGAGKSFLSRDLISLFPDDYEILLFTGLDEEDGHFKEFKDRLYKIRMTPENLQRLNLTEIRKRCKHPILLFDDVDKIRDKAVEKLTFAILEDALANGRGHKKHDGEGDVHVIVTSHALNDYRKTKYTLENSNYIALFPGSTTYVQLETMFKKLGLSMDLCRQIYDLGKKGVRRVIFHKVSPLFIITSSVIKLI